MLVTGGSHYDGAGKSATDRGAVGSRRDWILPGALTARAGQLWSAVSILLSADTLHVSSHKPTITRNARQAVRGLWRARYNVYLRYSVNMSGDAIASEKSGAQSRFQSLGVQFLGLGYCTEQNADGIPSFVHCRLLRNGNHTLHKKVEVVRPNFLGSRPPDPPVVAPLPLSTVGEKIFHEIA